MPSASVTWYATATPAETCTETHRTAECNAYRTLRCANCRNGDHASWSGTCPEFGRKRQELDAKYPELPITLNLHLHRMKRSDTPNCPICTNTEETIHHFLLVYLQYDRECFIMQRKLGRKASSLPFQLTGPYAMKHFLQYVNSTGRLKSTFGDATPDR